MDGSFLLRYGRRVWMGFCGFSRGWGWVSGCRVISRGRCVWGIDGGEGMCRVGGRGGERRRRGRWGGNTRGGGGGRRGGERGVR